ncbi:hypothetical protein N7U49_38340 [Streptomyces sp. AD2-2]|nr:hypothetical protein N7U49_38340 [Streptomyces sp. AD2-2]
MRDGSRGGPAPDQTRLFARKQWVTERFTPAQTAGDPALEVTTLRR